VEFELFWEEEFFGRWVCSEICLPEFIARFAY
jgi:hypothetical protein